MIITVNIAFIGTSSSTHLWVPNRFKVSGVSVQVSAPPLAPGKTRWIE